VEKKLQTGGPHLEGRDAGGVMKSALSWFEALGEMGIQSNLKEISEFDFGRSNYKGTTIILSHQISIPSIYWKPLENFVSKGGKLIVDGLTAYYDENAHCIMQTGFPFEKTFGAGISEFKLEGNLFEVKLTSPSVSLPGHCWRGYMSLSGATAMGTLGKEAIAARNKYGEGEVVWIPSLVGLAGRLQDYKNLQSFLGQELSGTFSSVPLRFKTPHKLMLMKLLQSGNTVISVIINKSKEAVNLELATNKKLTPSLLYSSGSSKAITPVLKINPEETLVIKWE
jgi:beta-galactosidase